MDKGLITKTSPIGVFDSGVGGISVVNTIRELLPHEDVVYFGDTLNAPYGVKSVEEVKNLSFQAVDFLVESGVKAVVIACNTATSASAAALRSTYDMIIIGMEPAVNLAVNLSHENIGVFATELTLREKKFRTLENKLRDKAIIYNMPAPKLVDYVENDKGDYNEFEAIVDDILSSCPHNPLDSVVLGCTHYVFLKDNFNRYFGGDVKIVDGNEGTVRHLKKSLEEKGLLNDECRTGMVSIYSSQKGVEKKMEQYVR